MKKILGFLFSCSLVGSSRAQTWDEWFHQNRTRIRYLQLQAAALQAYIAVAEKGYQLVEDGIKGISNIRQAEFDLHKGFFGSLATVNPALSDMPEVEEIKTLRSLIMDYCTSALNGYLQCAWLQPEELKYIAQVFEQATISASKEMAFFQDQVSSGRLEMTDGERMVRIRAIEEDLRDEYEFLKIFIANTDLLIQQRQQDSLDIDKIHFLYGNLN